jgi:outer membrane lipoprotein LolB
VTGYPLPVSRLAGWLLGREAADGALSRDASGRPLRLREAGWQIDFLYADETPAALPFRLNINRADEVMLNLRIEEWRDAP